MNQQASPLQKFISAIVIFGGLGVLGAIPAGLMGFFGGAQMASDMYVLAAIVISSWFPLKVLIDAYVKKQAPQWIIPLGSSVASFIMLAFGAIVVIPFLYMMTFTAFLTGILMYIFAGNSLISGLLAALLIQSFFIFRGAQREKELGVENNVFVRFHDMNMSQNYSISIDAQSSRAAEHPYDEKPDVLYLPSERLHDVEEGDNEDEGMTIRIDSQSEQDES